MGFTVAGGKLKNEKMTEELKANDWHVFNIKKISAWVNMLNDMMIPTNWTTFKNYTRISYDYAKSKEDQRKNCEELQKFLDWYNEEFNENVKINLYND